MIRQSLVFLSMAVALGPATLFADELKIVAAGDMRSFIPAGSTGPDTHTPIMNVYEGLTAWTANGTVAPMLAENLPAVSSDGLTYTFQLRDGVKFHDGTSLTAESVVKSWKFLLDPETAWPCRSNYDNAAGVKIEEISATGPLEVKFTLARPASEFLLQITRTDCAGAAIMAPAFVDAKGKGDKPIGTGPYKVDEISVGRYFVLSRFEDYAARSEPADGWAGKKEATVDTVRFVVTRVADTTSTGIMPRAAGAGWWLRETLQRTR